MDYRIKVKNGDFVDAEIIGMRGLLEPNAFLLSKDQGNQVATLFDSNEQAVQSAVQALKNGGYPDAEALGPVRGLTKSA